MVNEILARRYIKQVMKYGVPKHLANDIVATAMETGKGKDVEMYIDYAIRLIYGINVINDANKSIDNRA